jgi:hypothetical protein
MADLAELDHDPAESLVLFRGVPEYAGAHEAVVKGPERHRPFRLECLDGAIGQLLVLLSEKRRTGTR